MRERRLNLTSETVNFVSSLFDVYNKIISFCHLTSFYFYTMLIPREISFILSQEQLGKLDAVGGALPLAEVENISCNEIISVL